MDGLTVVLRLVHIVAGVLWAGIGIFAALLLAPAIQDSGPEGGKVMGALQRRGMMTLMPILAVTSILAGLWLYWRVSSGFRPSFVHSPMGMTLALGALASIAAFGAGIFVARPAMMKAGGLMQALGAATGEEERRRILAEAQRLRTRGGRAATTGAILLLLAVAAMAVARYL